MADNNRNNDDDTKIVVGGANWGQIAMAGAVVAGGVVAWFFILKPTLEWLNIKDTKAERKLKKSDAFDPNYFQDHLRKVTISTAKANKLATDIYTAYGFHKTGSGSQTLIAWMFASVNPIAMQQAIQSMDDNEKQVYNAIAAAGSKYNLSKVSSIFGKKYNEDMLEYIDSFMSNQSMDVIYDTIKSF